MTLSLNTYSAEKAAEWDEVVRLSLNGTFLFTRAFMDYHADRFHDCSLIIYKGTCARAVFPACHGHGDAARPSVVSHEGLTYGGLILTDKLSSAEVLDAYQLILAHYRECGFREIRVKPTPYIYHTQTAQEELYALFRAHATLEARGLSSAVCLSHPLPFAESRRSGLRKATRCGLNVTESRQESCVTNFHALLDQVVFSRHKKHPVHTAAEMMLLMARFPEEIRLFLVHDAEGELLAGAWVFDCGLCVHTQYLATSERGRQCGALDLLIQHLLHDVFPNRRYLDFGISTEDGGNLLNRPLLFQKEGFGGRGVCYDTYTIQLA